MARSNDRSRSRRVSGQVFFGGLAADGADHTAELPDGFAQLADAVTGLLFEYRARNLDAAALADALADLVVVDESGDEWTMGAKTLAWYRRTPGLPWVQVPPPDRDVRAAGRRAHQDLPPASAAAAPERALVDDPSAGDGPWSSGPSPVPAAPSPAGGSPAADPGPWGSAALSSPPVGSPSTVPLGGPFSALPPSPSYADGPLTGEDLDATADGAPTPS